MSSNETPEQGKARREAGDWTHDEIATLARYLADGGSPSGEVADAVEKPWHWCDEYNAALDQFEAEQAQAEVEGRRPWVDTGFFPR